MAVDHRKLLKDRGFQAQVRGPTGIRFGSKADVTLLNFDVCFTPESGHPSTQSKCPLCAKSGHSALHKERRYSIASSAIESTPDGTSMPSARAV